MTDKNAQALEALIHWLTVALNCRDWRWDEDQRKLAEYDVAKAKLALESAAPSAAEPVALTDAQIERAWRLGYQSSCGHTDGPNNEDANRDWNFDRNEVLKDVAATPAPSATSAAPTVMDEKVAPAPGLSDGDCAKLSFAVRDRLADIRGMHPDDLTTDTELFPTWRNELIRAGYVVGRATLPAVQPEAETSAEKASAVALAKELRDRSLNGIKAADEMTRSAMSRAAKMLEQFAAQADAPVAEPVALKRAQAVEIARQAAAATPKVHGYLRDALSNPDWTPHDWVVDAIMVAASPRPPAPEEGKDAAREPLTEEIQLLGELRGRRHRRTDAEVHDLAEKAGFSWIEPDGEEGGFPGGFDMSDFANMRRIVDSLTIQCTWCNGSGVTEEGDEEIGSVLERCDRCPGTGVAHEDPIYRLKCSDGSRCLHGCHHSEKCAHGITDAALSQGGGA